MDALEARSLFPITEHYIHMNHAGVAPMSLRVLEAISRLTESAAVAPYRDNQSQDQSDRVRELVGRLINAPASSIALTRSTSHGLSLLASGLDWNAGQNVVGAIGEFPSNVYPWMALRDRGVEYRQVKPLDGRVTPESVLSLVDSRTRVVALSHVEFWNGYRLDLPTIGAECRRRGIILAVDVMQSAGGLAVDVEELCIDFCAAGAGKWLMGPPGIGFCYCAPSLLERIRPSIVGPMSVEHPESFFDYDLTLAQGARRFEESVVSMLDTAAFVAALELLLEVGVDEIERRVLALAGRLAEGLAAGGCRIVEPWPRTAAESSGIVSFRKPGMSEQAVLRDLTAAHVIARTHADFVRLSPHFYNTEEEVDRVIDVLAAEGVTT